jgi:hypothetical protein
MADPVATPSNVVVQTENKHHPAICVQLPANGSVTLYADPNDPNATIYYNLLPQGHKAPVKGGGGGHGIIVGSGLSKESEAA